MEKLRNLFRQILNYFHTKRFTTIINKCCKLKWIISFEFRHVKLAEKKRYEKTGGDFVAISQAVYAHLLFSALHDADHIQRFHRLRYFRSRFAFVRTPDYSHVQLIFRIVKNSNSNRDAARVSNERMIPLLIQYRIKIILTANRDRERGWKVSKKRGKQRKNIKVWYLNGKRGAKKMSKIKPTLLSRGIKSRIRGSGSK